MATTHEREHTDAAMVAIPPVLRPAWRRRLLLYVLLPYFLAGSAARAAEAPGPSPGFSGDDALREDAYEWPRGPALEGLLPASAAGDEGLLATTSSSPACDGENLSLLRVSPWPGCGAQATLALGWGDDENEDGNDGRNTSSDVAASVSSLVASLGAAGRGATATVTHAPQTSGMTAIALAMPPRRPPRRRRRRRRGAETLEATGATRTSRRVGAVLDERATEAGPARGLPRVTTRRGEARGGEAEGGARCLPGDVRGGRGGRFTRS